MRSSIAIVAVSFVVLGACDNPFCPPNPTPPPCTPDAAGLSAATPVTLATFTPPANCALTHDATFAPPPGSSTSIFTEADAELLYACSSDVTTKPASGVDFSQKKIVIVAGEQLPIAQGLSLAWSVHNASGLHVGFVSGNCGGAAPAIVESLFVVDATDTVDVTACQADCGGNACDPPRP